MSKPLVHFPTYVGLFAAQVLAIACNAFLYIRYQHFGLEVALWAIAFGASLVLGWSQRGSVTGVGRWGQGIAMAVACIASLFVFIPFLWFPRAGLAMLAALLVVHNCITVTWRHLHIGLLISAAMVIYATSYHGADWSMLFYLIPYVASVIFVLVSEQINRRAQELKSLRPGSQIIGGQSAAIVAAMASILLLAGLLYAVTPHVTRPYQTWRYGQLAHHGGAGEGAGSRGSRADGSRGQQQDKGSEGRGEWGIAGAWPSSGEMRRLASRTGMPKWQRAIIIRLADGDDWINAHVVPVLQNLRAMLKSLRKRMKENKRKIANSIFLLIILLLLYGLWCLIREAKVTIWIRTQMDYLRFGILGLHAKGNDGARQYFSAVERLFALRDIQRSSLMNTREYLAAIYRDGEHRYLYRELSEMMRLFEDARYGPATISDARLARMRNRYREIYQSLQM